MTKGEAQGGERDRDTVLPSLKMAERPHAKETDSPLEPLEGAGPASSLMQPSEAHVRPLTSKT